MSVLISNGRPLRALLAASSLTVVLSAACGDTAGGNAGAGGGAGAGKAGQSGTGSGGNAAGGGAGTGSGATAGAGAGAGNGGKGAATGGSAGAAGGGSGGGAGTGTGGAKGGASGAGSGGKGGSGGMAGGRAGAGGSDAGAAGMLDAGAGNTPGGGCAGRDLLICEDFEGTDVGAVPNGWTRHGDLAAVNDDDAHGGRHALKLGPSESSERRIYHDAALLGSAHWGRIYYKVKTPTPDAFVHSTMVSLIGDGPKNGRSDYRPIDTVKQAIDTPDVGGRHNFIYNVQIIGASEFGTETSYDYHFDAMWHCAEYHIQASDQSYALYLDGEQILSFTRGAGNYDKSDIPDSFDELRVGWINYQSAPPGFTAWIDDVAFDDQRIGCD